MKKTTAQKIKDEVSRVLDRLGWPNQDWQVYIPDQSVHGHYAVNVAMVLAPQLKADPMQLAGQITKEITAYRTEVARPGFINFFLTSEQINQEWREFVTNFDQQLTIDSPRKIQVEFVSANPTGPLTLGNSRGGFFGDLLGNILARVGHQVVKEYYINDAGFQVKRLGEAVLGQTEDAYRGDYIEELKQIVKSSDANEAGREAADYILENMIKPDIQKIGLNFDIWFSERDLYQKKIVERTLTDLKNKGLTIEKEGALWLNTTSFGDQKDRVLVKATGEMTYLMTDLAYHRQKFERGFDLVIDIWGADHHGHIQPLTQGLKALDCPIERLKVLTVQWVKILKDGQELRSSKRRGEYITIAELVDQVGLDAVRYFFLDRSLNSHLNFDFNLAVKKSTDNPVYYIQYAHARINSIFDKLNYSPDHNILPKTNLDHPQEITLMALLLQYPEVVLSISQSYDGHKLPQFSYRLASALHQFYRDCPVVNAEPDQQQSRLALLATVKKVLGESLKLMGINAPDKM